MNDLISVIIPVYNVEQYLDRCINSIVNQTYTNLEIILVDDGSPDNCPTMCDKWAEKDNRIKVIHKENGGLSDARNAGLASATGKYIAFVDSDDWIDLNYVAFLYDALIKNNADISVCNYRETSDYDEQTNNDNIRIHSFDNFETMKKQSEANYFKAVVWNKLYKKCLLSNNPFKIGKYHEDEFFTYKILAKATKVVHINAELYFYYQRNGSIINSYSIKHTDALEAYVERIKFLEVNYPDIAHYEKMFFPIWCVNQYCDAIANNCTEAFKKIKSFRKQIKISLRELLKTSFKNQIYIVFSAISIDAFARLLHFIRKI